MTTALLREVLGWCAVINLGVLLYWFLALVFARDWIYKLHCKWFKMPMETFNAIHYAGIVFYKISIFMFFIVPYFVLRIVF